MEHREMKKKKKSTKLIISSILAIGIMSLIIVSFSAVATIAVAHNAGCVQTSTSSKTCTITITITAGNTAMVAINHISGTVSTIVGGGTYTQRVTKTNTVIAEIWTTPIAGATTASSIVITMSANGRFVAHALDISGATFLGPTQTSGTTGANPTDSKTIVSANDWLFTSFAGNLATTPTAGTGTLYNPGSTTGIDGGLVGNTAASVVSVTTSETLASSTWAGAMIEIYQGSFFSTNCSGGSLTASSTTYISGVTTYIRFTCTADTKAYTTSGSIAATPSFVLPAPFTQLWSYQSSTSPGTACSAGTGAWQMTSGSQHTFPSGSTTWDLCALIPSTATVDSTSFTVTWSSP